MSDLNTTSPGFPGRRELLPDSRTAQIAGAAFDTPADNEDAIWVKPDIVCTVKFMEEPATGSLRQPAFKGLRDDKTAAECVEQ